LDRPHREAFDRTADAWGRRFRELHEPARRTAKPATVERFIGFGEGARVDELAAVDRILDEVLDELVDAARVVGVLHVDDQIAPILVGDAVRALDRFAKADFLESRTPPILDVALVEIR